MEANRACAPSLAPPGASAESKISNGSGDPRSSGDQYPAAALVPLVLRHQDVARDELSRHFIDEVVRVVMGYVDDEQLRDPAKVNRLLDQAPIFCSAPFDRIRDAYSIQRVKDSPDKDWLANAISPQPAGTEKALTLEKAYRNFREVISISAEEALPTICELFVELHEQGLIKMPEPLRQSVELDLARDRCNPPPA